VGGSAQGSVSCGWTMRDAILVEIWGTAGSPIPNLISISCKVQVEMFR
jgi:hypothetical protein